jgi:holo-[acyl-carrier protein] synthase
MITALSSRVLGIGVDLVDVERFEAVIARQGECFLERIFTRQERDYCSSKKSPASFFAVRFAAKEAVSKAFGTGIGAAVGWQDIEVRKTGSGAPEIVLLGRGAELGVLRGVQEIFVSLSHTERTACAQVLLQGH